METTDRTRVNRLAMTKSRWAAGITHRWTWLAALTLLILVVGVLVATIV